MPGSSGIVAGTRESLDWELLTDQTSRRWNVTFAVELAQAGAQLDRLIQEVDAGAEVVITRDGHPVARLVAATDDVATERVPGSAKGLFTVPDDFDAPIEDFRDYM
jgi:prevent-host-death family protein